MFAAFLGDLNFIGVVADGGHCRHGLRLFLRESSAAQDAVHIGLELDFNVVLINPDFLNDELEVVAVQFGLGQDVVKNLHGRFGRSVDLDDGVALVYCHGNLVLDTLDAAEEVALQLVVGFLQGLLLVGVLHNVPDTLALGGFQLLLEVCQHCFQIGSALLRLRYVLRFFFKIRVETVQHGGGVVFHFLNVNFQQLVQLVHPDVVAGAPLQTPAVVGTAAVGVFQIGPAHGEHGGAAVAAEQEAGIHVVVFLHTPVVGGGAALPLGPDGGEGTVVDDGLVVVLDNDVVYLVPLDLLAVDFPAGILALAQGADVEVVVQDALHGNNGPGGLDGAAALLPCGLFALPLGHAGGGDALVGEVVGDLLVAPAVQVELEDTADYVRLGGHHLELLALVHNVAIGGGADPFAVLLTALDNSLYLFAGVGNGHFVDDKCKLDFQPVVVIGEVHVFPNGDDADARVPQVLQLHQAPAVAAGEAGEILDDEDILFVANQLPAHGLIAGALVEGVAGAVTVLVEGQGAVGEPLFHKVLNDGFLVFDGGVVPIQLLVHGNATVAGDVEVFDHVPASFLSIYVF